MSAANASIEAYIDDVVYIAEVSAIADPVPPEVPEPPVLTFEQWTADQGLTGANAEPDASPARDGVPNRLKFALGLDPNVPVARNDLPRAAVDAEGRLTLTYFERDDVDAAYIPQVSTNLVDWSAEDVLEVSRVPVEDGEEVTVRAAVPGDPDRVFLRLLVE